MEKNIDLFLRTKNCHLLLILFVKLSNYSSCFTNSRYLFHNVVIKDNARSYSLKIPSCCLRHWILISSPGEFCRLMTHLGCSGQVSHVRRAIAAM